MDAHFNDVLDNTKLKLLDMHYESKTGHIGGNFSCLDILMTLHHKVMTDKDRFILSKGHAAGALYATLWSLGKLTDEDLTTFSEDNTSLPGHPSGNQIPGLMFSTGSLGHGTSLACGLAMAAKHQDTGRRIYCVCSDGEWQEGSCWEALIFASNHKLDNLIIVIDQNGLQGFGRTQDVVSYENIGPKIEAFNVNVRYVDGHDPADIIKSLELPQNGRPTFLIAKTVKGHDAHYENLLESHYLPLSPEDYVKARNSFEKKGQS